MSPLSRNLTTLSIAYESQQDPHTVTRLEAFTPMVRP